MRNRNDISIGEDQWIEWIEVDDHHSTAFDVDSLTSDLMSLFSLLETECVVACCGIDAYRFWPSDITRAVTLLDDPQLVRKVDTAINQIRDIDAHVVVSHKLNNYFAKSVFMDLLDHISSIVKAGDSGGQGM